MAGDKGITTGIVDWLAVQLSVVSFNVDALQGRLGRKMDLAETTPAFRKDLVALPA
jgi:hypothetical protein